MGIHGQGSALITPEAPEDQLTMDAFGITIFYESASVSPDNGYVVLSIGQSIDRDVRAR